VQDALQLLTEYVQIVRDKTEAKANNNNKELNNNDGSSTDGSDSVQKRYALFKDGVRLEEDKLLAELLDPQVLWCKVVCAFKEIGLVRKQVMTPRKASRASAQDEEDGVEREEEGPNEGDCHLLVLYRKQQAFRNFHFDPSITVGQAIKTVTEAFNIPATTINPDDWSFRNQRANSLNKSTNSDNEGDVLNTSAGTNASTPNTAPGTPTSNTTPTSNNSTASSNTNSGNDTDNTSSAGSSPNEDVANPQSSAVAVPVSPKPVSFPFSLFTSSKNAFMFELAPVQSPTLSLSSSGSASSAPSTNDAPSSTQQQTQPQAQPQSSSSAPTNSGVPTPPPQSSPMKAGGAAARGLKREMSMMGGELDTRHECILSLILSFRRNKITFDYGRYVV
jgi:hypothetical protein